MISLLTAGPYLKRNMPLLFEYGKWGTVADRNVLKRMLQDLWQQYSSSDIAEETDETNEEKRDMRYQPFLQFDGNQIRARNFVGFIQNGNELIEIYPKIFKDISDMHLRKELMLRHIFYWFSYCRKWRFPFNFTSLDTIEIDNFPDRFQQIF